MQDKLYVVTRADLSPGQQATQSTHAALKFAVEHFALTRAWFEDSTYLVLLQVPDEEALQAVVNRLDDGDTFITQWHEPDLGNSLTAICVEPDESIERKLSSLPLLLKEPAMT